MVKQQYNYSTINTLRSTGENLFEFLPVGEPEWQDVIQEVRKILRGPSAVIAKPTRAGFTTAAVKIAKAEQTRLLHIAPTNKLKETIGAADPDNIPIFGHSYCQRLQDKYDDFVLSLPLPLPTECPKTVGGCKHYPECQMTRSWFETAFVRSVTYDKLAAIMFCDSTEAKYLREMLKDVEIVFCDESHHLSLLNVPTADSAYDYVVLPDDGFKHLEDAQNRFVALKHDLDSNGMFDEIKSRHEYSKSGMHLSLWWHNSFAIFEPTVRAAFTEIVKLAKRRASIKISEQDIKHLFNIISVMSCHEVSLNLISTSEGAKWQIKGKAGYGSPTTTNAIRLFLKRICPNARIYFVSGSQFECVPGYFDNIADQRLVRICLPDCKMSNSKMTIYPDTWTYDSFKSKIKRVKEQIFDVLAEHPCEPVYVICFNKRIHNIISKVLKGKLPEGSMVDWYRSASTLGVKCEARLGIAIGCAEIPSHAYDFQTESYRESRSLRLQSVHSATWQSWSRIKDPAGKVPSALYCIGVRAEQASKISLWGSDRTIDADGSVLTAQELPRPKIMMVKKSKQLLEPARLKVADVIDSIVPISQHPRFADVYGCQALERIMEMVSSSKRK